MDKIQIKVEYESVPIRHLAIQCPNCKNWFHGTNIAQKNVVYEHDLYYLKCNCPVCNHYFNTESNYEITEISYPQIYDKCLNKKVTWE